MEKTAVRPCGRDCDWDLDLVYLKIHKLVCEFLCKDFIYLTFLTVNENLYPVHTFIYFCMEWTIIILVLQKREQWLIASEYWS